MSKVTNTIKKGFDSKPVSNEKYLRTKIKSYEVKIGTKFHRDKIQNEGFQCLCISVKLIDSVCRIGKNYYSQVFLEKCKYSVK